MDTNTESAVEVPAKFKDLVESIEKMSVMELNELVKLLEKKFGVSAAAVAVAGPAAGAAAAEEKDSYGVEITESGATKIAWGAKRCARPTGIAALIPNFRAS